MLILAIDTSGKPGSLALARGDASHFEVIESVVIPGGTFSAQLVPQISSALSRHNLKKEQLEGFAAASGPGSFTGLRVGLAAIKALAEIMQKPIAAVSVLEAVAAAANYEGKIISLLDAQRHEIFVGQYELRGGAPVRLREFLCPAAELAAVASSSVEFRGARLVTPDESLLALVPGIQKVSRPGSVEIARLGLHKILAGETVSVEELDANYIRRSDAEIFSAPKLARP
jgi:tRNA threonylcarbamoyladenosine biosynthesis protein TsaB